MSKKKNSIQQRLATAVVITTVEYIFKGVLLTLLQTGIAFEFNATEI